MVLRGFCRYCRGIPKGQRVFAVHVIFLSRRARALPRRAASITSGRHVQRPAHADDGAVPAHQVGAPPRHAAAVPARRLLRDVLRGRGGRRPRAQPHAHAAERRADVRAAVPCRVGLSHPPAPRRTQGGHLRPDRGGAPGEAGGARGHRHPVARHALRRTPAGGGPEQLPRRPPPGRPGDGARLCRPHHGRLPGDGAAGCPAAGHRARPAPARRGDPRARVGGAGVGRHRGGRAGGGSTRRGRSRPRRPPTPCADISASRRSTGSDCGDVRPRSGRRGR